MPTKQTEAPDPLMHEHDGVEHSHEGGDVKHSHEEPTYPARTMMRPELHDEPVREDTIVGGPVEKAKPVEYREPTDKQQEKLAEVAAGDTREDPKVFSAKIVDNAYMELCVDGTDFKLYPDEVHQLSNVISGAAVELPR